jgi:hypothetical protein
VDPERARAYGRETGFTGEGIPSSYPAVWLAEPQVRAVIAKVCEAEESVPVHESQSFTYAAPLRAGEGYDFSVTFRREATPPRLVLDATATALSGELRARIETVMRIVPRAAFESASS